MIIFHTLFYRSLSNYSNIVIYCLAIIFALISKSPAFREKSTQFCFVPIKIGMFAHWGWHLFYKLVSDGPLQIPLWFIYFEVFALVIIFISTIATNGIIKAWSVWLALLVYFIFAYLLGEIFFMSIFAFIIIYVIFKL